jgi:hypothetical protein
MPQPKQPVTDDSIQVRQLREEVLTVDADDADNLQDMLSVAEVVHYDIRRRCLMFGTTPVGSA